MGLRVIPVLDLSQGRAVHAVGGERSHYQPVRSHLHEGSAPIGLARAFRDLLGLRALYLADLDAIAGAPADAALYRALSQEGLDLWIDAGVRDLASLPPLIEAGVGSIVVGLETVRGPESLAAILGAVGPGKVVFSLDLKAGRPLVAEGADWGRAGPVSIARAAIDRGVTRLLVLDLARVGTGRGVGSRSVLAALRATGPDLELTAGGGVAGLADLIELESSEADAVLVGSALLDGRIGPAELTRLWARSVTESGRSALSRRA